MRINVSEDVLTDLELIPSRIRRYSESNPTGIALRHGSATIDYLELERLVARGSRNLVAAGCSAGCRVAIIAGNSVEYVAAFLSVIRFGACAVTLPTMLQSCDLARLLDDCGARYLLWSASHKSMTDEAMSLSERQSYVEFSIDGGPKTDAVSLFALDEADSDSVEICVDPDTEFNIVYSSGTTGMPKGILHSHATRARLAAGFAGFGFDTDAVTVVSTPLYTNMSIPAVLGTLYGGGTIEVVDKFEPGQYLELAKTVGATHYFLVPVQVSRLLDDPAFEHADLSTTRLKYVAGSKLQPEIKRRLIRDWPGATVEVYGMSEGAPFTVLFASEQSHKLESVGQAPAGSSLAVIDDDDNILPHGEVGEIVGFSGAMMLGYNNRPEETMNLVWHHPDGRDFFRSGDVGYLDADGYLYIVDRKKDMIISGGYNVFSSDLEDVILKHPSVDEAAVVAAQSERWGETPVAYVVRNPSGDLDEEALLEWANERLGKFQRLARIEYRTCLPRNALGKVLKRELKDQCTPLP